MKKYQVLCFANQKGGVGKTTSAINVAACLARAGREVLLIDADPQGNATGGLGIRKKGLSATIYDVLIGRRKAADVIVKTKFKRLSVLPAGIDLVGAELELADEEHRESRLKDAVDEIRDRYDYIIIDCPPALGLITINTLIAADGVIIPLLWEYYSLEGLTQLTSTLKKIQTRYNPKLELVGVQINMYDGRLNLTASVLEEIKRYFPRKLFKTPVPRTVRISEAPSYGMPITEYDPNGKGAAAYASITKELMERCGDK